MRYYNLYEKESLSEGSAKLELNEYNAKNFFEEGFNKKYNQTTTKELRSAPGYAQYFETVLDYLLKNDKTYREKFSSTQGAAHKRFQDKVEYYQQNYMKKADANQKVDRILGIATRDWLKGWFGQLPEVVGTAKAKEGVIQETKQDTNAFKKELTEKLSPGAAAYLGGLIDSDTNRSKDEIYGKLEWIQTKGDLVKFVQNNRETLKNNMQLCVDVILRSTDDNTREQPIYEILGLVREADKMPELVKLFGRRDDAGNYYPISSDKGKSLIDELWYESEQPSMRNNGEATNFFTPIYRGLINYCNTSTPDGTLYIHMLGEMFTKMRFYEFQKAKDGTDKIYADVNSQGKDYVFGMFENKDAFPELADEFQDFKKRKFHDKYVFDKTGQIV